MVDPQGAVNSALKVLGAYYPPPAFYFNVSIFSSTAAGIAMAVANTAFKVDVDGKFQEVSGITAEFETEDVAEGGENRFKHKLPTRGKYPNLSLKRGAVTCYSPLANWCSDTLNTRFIEPITTKTVKVDLLNQSGAPTLFWIFYNAYPVKWEVSSMSSQDNKILTETIEMSYNYFKRYNTYLQPV